VQNSLYVQVLRSGTLAALLHGTPAAGVSQTLRRGSWYKEWNYGTFANGATYIRLGGHHVGHRPTFWLSSELFVDCVLSLLLLLLVFVCFKKIIKIVCFLVFSIYQN